MRSKILQRILDNTPKEVDLYVDEYVERLLAVKEEIEKCKNSPYYFFNTYYNIKNTPHIDISEEEFNNLFFKNNTNK